MARESDGIGAGLESAAREEAQRLAHDAAQPLTAIGFYASGALARLRSAHGGDPEVLAALENIVAEVERAARFLRRLRRRTATHLELR